MPHLAVSVIIPTFNRSRLLGRAIRSAMRQCVAGDEIIVVDDGSTDDTASLVNSFGAPVCYIQTPNGGAGRARNTGLRHATRPLVAFLDSDDEWFEGKLSLQRAVMQARPDVLFTFSNFAVTLKSGQPVRRYLRRWLTAPLAWDEALGPGVSLREWLPDRGDEALPDGGRDANVHVGSLAAAELVDNYVLTSSLMVRRLEAGDALTFAEDLPTYEDWYCFARLARRGPAAYLDCETCWQHGAAEDRLTDAGTLARARAWLSIHDRVWADDLAFQQQHAARYAQAVLKWRMELARGLIGHGEMRQARGALAGLPRVPLAYRLLARVPGVLLRPLAAARRRFLQPT